MRVGACGRRTSRAALGALLAALSSCAFLGWGEDGAADPGAGGIDDQVSVVSEGGAFDPSAAVDDDDGPVKGRGDGAPDAPPPEPAGEPSQPGPDEERVATPAEVEARAASREQAVEGAEERAQEGGADDDEAKAQLSTNPPPEPPPEGEALSWTLVDVLLEGVIVAAAALFVTALLVFANSHRKIVAGLAAAGLAAGAFLWWQAG